MRNNKIELKSVAIPISEKTPPDGRYSVFHCDRPNDVDHNMQVFRGMWGKHNGDGFFSPIQGVPPFTHYIEKVEMSFVDFNIDPDKYYVFEKSRFGTFVTSGKSIKIIDGVLQVDGYYVINDVYVSAQGEISSYRGCKRFKVHDKDEATVIKSEFQIYEIDWNPEKSITRDTLDKFSNHLKQKFDTYYENLSGWVKFWYGNDFAYYKLNLDEEWEEWKK